MNLALRMAERESRNALRMHGFALSLYMTIIGLGFLQAHPILGTRPLYDALDDRPSPLVWGVVLTTIGTIRLFAVALSWLRKSNPRPSIFTSVMTGISGFVWSYMAFVYFTEEGGGSSLALLAFVDASTCIYASRISGTASGRRLVGRTIGD